tara:strand:+ start:8731 stop:9318 length:588 start_codon:yes stop_codon:yes gene_type:complete
MLLGLAALAALVLVLFMTGEFKNKSTFSSDGHVNSQVTSVARASLDLNDLNNGLYEQLYGDIHLGRGQGIVDPLYAQGGGYDTYDVPYGKDEDPQLSSGGKKITDTHWVRDYEKEATTEKVDTERLSRLAAHQRYYNPYTMKKFDIHKQSKHMKHLDKKWDKEEERKLHVLAGAHDPHHGVVSNRHTRHAASAGH